jgi:glucodextranase-like protein
MPDPMIALDPGGSAPTLSYQLPDSTSYAGRHYIVVELPAETFKPEVGAEGDGSDPRLIGSGPREEDLGVLLGPDVVALVEQPDGTVEVRSELPLGDSLKSLTVDDLRAMRREGLRPAVARSLAGTLALLAIPDSGGGTGEPSSEPPVSGPPEIPAPVVDILLPEEGAEVTGPVAGLDLFVEGTSSVEEGRGSVGEVEVRLDDGAAIEATQVDSGSWDLWRATVPISTPGVHELTARASHSLFGSEAEVVRNFTVRLVSTAGDDTSPPRLTITSPVDGTNLITSTETIQVSATGTAQDDRGLAGVSVDVDGAAGVSAQVAADGTWSADLLISGAGRHLLTARATDAAGNATESKVGVTLSVGAPRTLLRSYLALVESYRLSSFLGRYGAGRVIKTFSLLPGERTKISVKTWQRSTETAKAASSIVDSVTTESATEFADALESENTDKQTSADRNEWEIKGKVEQGWGLGRAEISARAAGGCNAAREEFGKTVTNVTQKHVAEASSRRDVTINSEYERTEEVGEETSLEREIANVNVSRTLNFVFRQMNQEFATLLHLVDVRVAFVRVYRPAGATQNEVDYREVRLTELPSLLDQVVVRERRADVEQRIMNALRNVADYVDELHDVTETVVPEKAGMPVPEAGYVRVRRGMTQEFRVDPDDPATAIEVPGVILSATTNVMRTEGVIVDALLGQGDGLDTYSHGLQDATVAGRNVDNDLRRQELEEARQRAKIVTEEDEEAAAVWATVHPVTPGGLSVQVGSDQDGEEPG